MSYDQAAFRITHGVWSVINMPLVSPAARMAAIRVTDECVVPDGVGAVVVDRRFVDLHFRLARINPDDDHSIGQWAEEHGLLDWFRGSPEFAGDEKYGEFEFAGVEADASEILMNERTRVFGTDARYPIGDTRLEWRCAISALQDMLRSRRWAIEGLAPDNWSSPAWLWPRPDNAFDAMLTTVAAMNKGLEAFAPRAEVYRPDDGEFPGYRVLAIEDATLWQLAMASLWNDLVRGEPYRVCANTTCGCLFQHQLGRAIHAQHRSAGLKYCSAECARAQAQRDYRARKRTKATSADEPRKDSPADLSWDGFGTNDSQVRT